MRPNPRSTASLSACGEEHARQRYTGGGRRRGNETPSGNSKFFLGTDTAPHLTKDKESACGCAGVFNATYCLSILAQLFDNENALPNLEKFISRNGAVHYNLNINKETIFMVKSNQELSFKEYIYIEDKKIKIFQPDFSVFWTVRN